MSTRAIIFFTENNKKRTIYCHRDGYPSDTSLALKAILNSDRPGTMADKFLSANPDMEELPEGLEVMNEVLSYKYHIVEGQTIFVRKQQHDGRFDLIFADEIAKFITTH